MSTEQLPTITVAGRPANAASPLDFITVLRQMLKASDKVSDLLFSPGRPPQVELTGKLVPVRVPGLEKLLPAHTAVIDLINEIKYYHIVTIEDPIEFLHPHKNSTIHQRELHSDTPNFSTALRAALRQAPKVILVGEMRDRETIEVALEAAETGHLVLSTLHTIDAA